MGFGSIDDHRFKLGLGSDSLNRLVLSAGERSFTLGPRTNPVGPSGRPEIDFAPEPGDEVAFTSRRSALGWPTPFEFHILKPRSRGGSAMCITGGLEEAFRSKAGNAVAL